MSVQNPQLAGFLLPGNRSNFLYVEGFSAWLYDCHHFLSPLYKPEPIKRKPPLMFTPSQIKTTIRPNTFTAQDAGIYSNAELDQFWIRILFSKHSDSTLQLRAKTPSYSFISSDTPDYDANSPYDNPYKTLRFGLHDKLLNLTPLFTPTWFSDALIGLFGYPCYVLTQCGIYFSTFLFIQATLTLIVKLYETISIKYNLKNNITLALYQMVSSTSLQHKWSMTLMMLKTKNRKIHF